MTQRTFLPSLAIALGMSLLAVHAAQPDCTDIAGWNSGRHGQTAEAACTADAYVEAFRLGQALADLRTRHAALETRITQSPDQAGALRRQQRQIDVDIEAIHGVATLRGWPTRLPEGETP